MILRRNATQLQFHLSDLVLEAKIQKHVVNQPALEESKYEKFKCWKK